MLLTTALLPFLHLILLPSTTLTLAATDSSKSKPPPKPCTIHSPSSGSYFDLNSISLSPPALGKDGKKVHEKDTTESWHARGYDYPANFTMNFCAPVIEDVKHVVGVARDRWQNVSAYYELDGKVYSIGQQSSAPLFRGRKLVLNYTDGSPCPSKPSSLSTRKIVDGDGPKDHDDDDDEDEPQKPSKPPPKSKPSERRKSTLISLLCDRDPLAPPAAVHFVGTTDNCSYFFEVRSQAACGGVAADTAQTVGPGGVFGIIAAIAIAAYLIGGCAYQRTVMHQRGWRQCPNYGLWAGILSFFGDLFIIITSSIGRMLPCRRGGGGSYSRVGSGLNGSANGSGSRNRTSDDENRLIDQLDEEWDD